MAGLAACDGEEPAPTDPPTSEEPTSDEPTSGEPTGAEVESPVPRDSIARDDVHGAEAAAEYFLALYPYVYATGDLTEWEQMAGADCEFCQSVIDGVNEMHGNGGHREGGEIRFEAVEGSEPPSDSSFYFVRIEGNEAASRDINSGGEVAGSTDSTPVLLDVALDHSQDSGWIVHAVVTDVESE